MTIRYKDLPDQGELRIDSVSALPSDLRPTSVERRPDGFVMAHSESGNHHVLSGDVDVLERTDTRTGMDILYAIVKEGGAKLWQDAGTPHKPVMLDEGIYSFRTKREYDPFAEEVRRVAD